MTDVIWQIMYTQNPLRLRVKNIILKERPDSILPTLGADGLVAMELAQTGFLKTGVKLLGTRLIQYIGRR